MYDARRFPVDLVFLSCFTTKKKELTRALSVQLIADTPMYRFELVSDFAVSVITTDYNHYNCAHFGEHSDDCDSFTRRLVSAF